MFEVRLFLGFAVDPLFSAQLKDVNPLLIAQYVSENDEQLQEVTYLDIKFLGKSLENLTSLSKLELAEANIYSLLKKLVPKFPYEETSLYLFAIDA